jgi:putative phosphoribosyl transferase
MIFQNRTFAGRLLAEHLKSLSSQNPIIFALPRGGVPIGYEIAKKMGAPLEVLVVRKIGAPFNPEYGIGAITEDGSYWIDPYSSTAARATQNDIERTVNREFAEVTRRIVQYREGLPLPNVVGRTVIVVDDGLATGVTARVACHYLKSLGAKNVILAVPVCSARTASALRQSEDADEVICLHEPELFYAVGQFYEDFEQTSDEEVIALLSDVRSFATVSALHREEAQAGTPSFSKKEVRIKEGGITLPGSISIPSSAKGLVIFAHGSGSSRLSPRNQQVAGALVEAGLATLLFDLLTEEESWDRLNVFDIPLLASRLVLATKWVRRQKFGKGTPLGYFGASTGAAAALFAAAELQDRISAVVSRGGRPDLAIPKLHLVTAPTLLIVGGSDEPVIGMNREAMNYLSTANLIMIPGATHLFEEPGALEQVSQEAVSWFLKYLGQGRVARQAA